MGDCKVIGFLGADWWGSDPRAMANEFRNRGHLLIERHYEDYLSTKWRGTALRAARRFMRSRIQKEYNRAVLELLANNAINFVLVFKGMLLEAATLEKFINRGIPCYLVYPDVSFKDHGENIWQCLPHYDCVFTTKSFHIGDAEISERAQKLRLINHGYDPEVHRPVKRTRVLESTYTCDVSFVGCWSIKKEQFISHIINQIPSMNLVLWGPGWANANEKTQQKWRGRGAFGDELASIYSFSKINLGLLSEAGTGTTSGDLTTARSWQIPASGGFLLHENNEEIRNYYSAETEIGVFSNEQELASKIKYYLANEKQRKQIATTGHHRCTSAPYTYQSAVETILEHHEKCY